MEGSFVNTTDEQIAFNLKLENLKSEHEKISNEYLNRLDTQTQEHTFQILYLKENIESEQMDKKELLKQADSLRNEISKQIHNHTFICSTMKDQLKEQNDKLDEYTYTIDKLTNLNNKFQEENSTKEQEINSLKDSIVLLDKKEELNAVKQKVVDLCFEIDELNNQIEQQNR